MTTTGPAVHQDPTAVMGRRAVAYLIDIVIALALIVVVFAMVATTEELSSPAEAELVCERINDSAIDLEIVCVPADSMVVLLEDSDLVTLLLVPLVYFLATQVLLPALTGFSPGKALVGLRIVNKETFAKAGFGANLIRALLWIVDSLPFGFVVPLVGIVTGLASKGHRRVGDMAASTLVIDRNQVGTPLPVPGVNSVLAAAAPAPSFGGSSPPPPPPGSFSPLSPPAEGTPAPPPPDGGTAAPPPPTSPPIAPPIAPSPAMPVEGSEDTTDTGEVEAVGTADRGESELTDQTSVFASPSSAPPSEVHDFAPPTSESPVVETPMAEPAPQPEPAAPESAAVPEPEPPPPAPEPSAPAEVRPGIDAPQWDDARDTYIQWDPERAEWMEWSASGGAWIPISQ